MHTANPNAHYKCVTFKFAIKTLPSLKSKARPEQICLYWKTGIQNQMTIQNLNWSNQTLSWSVQHPQQSGFSVTFFSSFSAAK